MKEYILGVEIGGTKLQLALGTPAGELLTRVRGQVEPSAGGEGIRAWLKEQIPAFLVEAESEFGSVSAIGCGFGGPVDTPQGRVLQSIQIEGWQDFPLRDWFGTTFTLPTTVDNDTNAAAWGEYCKGFGRGCQHFFYTNIGSGVGGGFVLNGELYDGQGYGAGELGHTWVPDWTSDRAGAAVEIENICSGWAIEARLRQPGYIPEESILYHTFENKLSEISTRDLASAAQAGDAFALNEIEQVATSFGLGLVNVLSLTNVERIAIGGGVAQMGEMLISRIRAVVDAHVFVSSVGRYAIQECELGEDIVLVGAILRAAQK